VNGVDFWNNSNTLAPAAQSKMGTVAHRRIVSTKNGKDSGELVVEMDWIMPNGKPILRETTRFIFAPARTRAAWIDYDADSVWTSASFFTTTRKVSSVMRVRRETEHLRKKRSFFTDASGKGHHRSQTGQHWVTENT
jgi:hypothetical protein